MRFGVAVRRQQTQPVLSTGELMSILRTLGSLLACSLVAAQGAAPQTTVSVTGEVAVLSKYLFAGIPFSSGAVTQPHAIVAAGGFTAHGFATYDHEDGELNEADLYADYYTQVTPILGAYAGAALYYYKIGDDFVSTPELYGGIVVGAPLNPTLHVAHDFDLGDGTHAMLSVSHAQRLGTSGVTLGLESSLVYNDSYWEEYWQIGSSDSGFSVFGLTATLGLPVGPVTVDPALVMQRAIHDDFTNQVAYGVRASWTF